MILRKFLLLMGFAVIAVNAISQTPSQTPSQTVTFKVRKPLIKNEAVVDTVYNEIIVVEKNNEPAFIIVEESATFNGGDINDFRIWVQKNMVYPTTAAEAGISGRVVLQFAVNSKGIVVDAKVLRGINPELDNEALRVVLKSPKWVPGKQGGKAIKLQFVIPIVFQLQ